MRPVECAIIHVALLNARPAAPSRWCTSPEVQAFGCARQLYAIRRTEVRESDSPAEAEHSVGNGPLDFSRALGRAHFSARWVGGSH